ncbi:MAG TPA: M48 family metallopeptidase [Gaiellaceae bacterium]|nr:M48 family metallopeptidase [Gaiellaceae bacterium]
MGQSFDFSHEERERARAYRRPLYLAALVDAALGVAVLAALAWGRPGRWLDGAVDGLGWAGAAAGYAALVVAVSTAVRLPLAWWRGFVRERRWGFSTQRARGWLADAAKGLVLSVVLSAGLWTGAVGLARALPGWWALPAGAALAAAVLVFSFLAPVVLEPLFNRFRPLDDARLAEKLRALAERAGVPVRDVLVVDASRRSTKTNAYVSGLGRTRRVVLFDTLLDSADERELALVVAHELGHRREGHVARLTLLGMLGAAVSVALLWAVLGTRVGSPRELPAALLLLLGLQVAGMPPGAALSRRWERVADRCSLELTGDIDAFERVHVSLARRNLADLAPPRLAYLFLFSHPTAPERLALAREWAAARKP